jgi:hypothetical protein
MGVVLGIIEYFLLNLIGQGQRLVNISLRLSLICVIDSLCPTCSSKQSWYWLCFPEKPAMLLYYYWMIAPGPAWR